MAGKKLRKGTFLHIEQEVASYHEIKQEIVRLKAGIIRRSNGESDPAGDTDTLLYKHEKLEAFQDMVNAIDYAYNRLTDEKKRLIAMKYWTAPQKLTAEGIADELNVNVRTVTRWRDEFIQAVGHKLGWR